MLQLPQKNTMTVREVAEYLSVSEDTVRRMISGGKLEASRVMPRCTRVTTKSVKDIWEAAAAQKIEMANGQFAWEFLAPEK